MTSLNSQEEESESTIFLAVGANNSACGFVRLFMSEKEVGATFTLLI